MARFDSKMQLRLVKRDSANIKCYSVGILDEIQRIVELRRERVKYEFVNGI